MTLAFFSFAHAVIHFIVLVINATTTFKLHDTWNVSSGRIVTVTLMYIFIFASVFLLHLIVTL